MSRNWKLARTTTGPSPFGGPRRKGWAVATGTLPAETTTKATIIETVFFISAVPLRLDCTESRHS